MKMRQYSLKTPHVSNIVPHNFLIEQMYPSNGHEQEKPEIIYNL